jgi:hypothetical protein
VVTFTGNRWKSQQSSQYGKRDADEFSKKKSNRYRRWQERYSRNYDLGSEISDEEELIAVLSEPYQYIKRNTQSSDSSYLFFHVIFWSLFSYVT